MMVAVFPDNGTVLLARRKPAGVAVDASRHEATHRVPGEEELIKAGLHLPEDLWAFAEYDGEDVTGVIMDIGSRAATGWSLSDGSPLEIVNRREAADLLDIDDFWAVNRAFHLAYWDGMTRFCGSCAAPMRRRDGEIAKVCSSCGHSVYPQIAPAVIVAVVRDGKLLMAHSHRSRGNMFSVLAGFAEPGETLERAVAREVYEESGVVVRNVEYFASQPWPFPNSLMIGFTAEYASGQLAAQESEIRELRWVAPSELPGEIPGTYSIARRLIEWFVSEHGSPKDLQSLLQRERT